MGSGNSGLRDYLKDYSKYSTLLFQMVAMALAGIIGGIELDKWLQLKVPVFTISLTIIMTLAAIAHLLKTLLKK
jgi:F0F1-type ATP synthase assembly protein I